MAEYWVDFIKILLPGLGLKLIATLPLLLATIGAVRHLLAERKHPYIRNLFGAIAAGVTTLGLLWSLLFGEDLSRSSTAGLVFLFTPIYSTVAFFIGYLMGVVANRASRREEKDARDNSPMASRARKLVWLPAILLGIVVIGITRNAILNNELSVAGRASRPETLRYLFAKAVAGEADTFGVPLFLAQNPNAPIDLLERLSKSDESQVRGFVVTNPSTPVSVVVGLREDCADNVRRAVRERLKNVSGADPGPQATPKCGSSERRN